MPDTNTALAVDDDLAEEEAAERRVLVKEKIEALGSEKEAEAIKVLGKRAQIEDRWYKDLRQKHGRYDEQTEAKLATSGKSRLYVKLTRPKCKIWSAKLTDLLFPTDDKNWSASPTPVPELIRTIEDQPELDELEQARDQFSSDPRITQGLGGPNQLEELEDRFQRGEDARSYQDEAKKASKGMEREMEDQLVETSYGIEARKCIDDAVDVGTGIMKGPFDKGKSRKRWVKKAVTGEDGEAEHIWTQIDEQRNMPRPDFTRVDYWAFFPDPNATCIEEAEYIYERHILTAKDLRLWGNSHGFDQDTIREMLREGTNDTAPEYLTKVRSITLQESASIENKYIVWEYRGPLSAENMSLLFEDAGDQVGMDHMSDLDPLDSIDVVLYVSNGQVLKFGIAPLDNEESIYSVFNLVKDPASIWGWGVPWLMRDSQSAVNAAWRMMMDNGGLSTGPQIVINRKLISPANGSWDLTARKLWYMTEQPQTGQGGKPFETFGVDSHQTELANIITMAEKFADQETNLPAISQGTVDETASSKNTYGGMALMSNAANVVFRDSVRDFDDNITVPNLRRLFDWNMQFNPKDEIKGDIKINARGSSVLLVREIQSQNMMIMMDKFGEHPTYGRYIKKPETLRSLVGGMMLGADDHIFTDEEIKQQEADEAEAAKNNPPPPTAEMVKLQQIKIESQTRIYVADKEFEKEMVKLASETDMTLEKLGTELTLARENAANRERTMAVEVGLKKDLANKAVAAGNGKELPSPTGTKLEG